MTTTTDRPAIATLRAPIRRRLVETIVTEVRHERTSYDTAVLMLDGLGLTGDREEIAHALAALYLRDGILDGSMDARQVDPELTVHLERAIEILADIYDAEYEQSVAILAAVRLAPGEHLHAEGWSA